MRTAKLEFGTEKLGETMANPMETGTGGSAKQSDSQQSLINQIYV